jgi:hypothetical protein
MSYLHHYMGLLGCLLLIMALPLSILKQPRFSRKTITIAIFLVMGLAVLPLPDMTLLVYVRAVIADLSITSMILLCLFIASSYTGQSYIKQENRHQLGTGILVGAVILYPMGLGLTPYDTYALGYGSLWLLALFAAYAAYLIWRGYDFILSLLLIAILAYLAGVLQSDNLWDYLLDPWLTMLVIATSIKPLLARIAAGRVTGAG